MKLPLSSILGIACLTAPACALGTGGKFRVVAGGSAFDRFITIWLENQVRRRPSALPPLAPR